VRSVESEQAVRDARDSAREHSPLEIAPGAVELDTTGLTLDEVVERVAALAAPALRAADAARGAGESA
jgi:cytidylate kinase